MPKQRPSQVNKKEQEQRDAFWEAIKAVEKEHGFAIGCYLEYSAFGIVPTIGAKKLEPSPSQNDG